MAKHGHYKTAVDRVRADAKAAARSGKYLRDNPESQWRSDLHRLWDSTYREEFRLIQSERMKNLTATIDKIADLEARSAIVQLFAMVQLQQPL